MTEFFLISISALSLLGFLGRIMQIIVGLLVACEIWTTLKLYCVYFH